MDIKKAACHDDDTEGSILYFLQCFLSLFSFPVVLKVCFTPREGTPREGTPLDSVDPLFNK